MSTNEINQDIDFIIEKTKQLTNIVDQEQYHLLETKELIRQQLVQQFNDDYSANDMLQVQDKLILLHELSTHITQQCEKILTKTKEDILKLKQVKKVNKAYKK